MSQQSSNGNPLVLPTSMGSVELREISRQDAVEFFNLVQRNRDWLTRYGDYHDLVKSGIADIDAEFSVRSDSVLRMGIWCERELMGRVDTAGVALGAYVLGYWIGEEYHGRGYMTVSCRALMDYSRRVFMVKEFWAGVRHANLASIAVAERLGFRVFEELPDRKRYRLDVEPQTT